MKHFYHYLLTVFLAGQVPGWGQNATEKKHIFVNDSITVDLPEVFVKAGTAAGESVGRQVAVRHSKNLVKDKPVDNAFDVIGELPGIYKKMGISVDYRNPFDLDPDQRTQKFDDSGTIGWLIEIIFIQSKTNRCDV